MGPTLKLPPTLRAGRWEFALYRRWHFVGWRRSGDHNPPGYPYSHFAMVGPVEIRRLKRA